VAAAEWLSGQGILRVISRRKNRGLSPGSSHRCNPYVNEAVTMIMENAQAIVVMLSPDDEAKLKDQFLTKSERSTEGKLRGQARPNVIFETGIAIGTYHKKTVMVQV
jgi:hypothetical protein